MVGPNLADPNSSVPSQADLRIGIVGLGLRANLVEAAHRPGRGSQVVALCDLDRALLARYGSAVSATAAPPMLTEQFDELLAADDLDAIAVCTPDHLHEEMVVASLRAGKATFAEKPLAISTAGCDRILQAAYETGTRLYVGHNMRHFPMVRLLKSLIDDGAIGDIRAIWCRHFVGHGGDFYFKDWHAQRRHVNGLLLQKGAHDIDVIHWLAGAPSARVHAFGGLTVYGDVTDRHDGDKHADWFAPETHWPPLQQRGLHPEIDIEDLSMMQMTLTNGVLASYGECHFSPDYWRNYTVIGTEGRIENFGDVDGVVRLWNRRTGFVAGGHREFAFHRGEGGHGGADDALMAEFVRFAARGGATDTSPVAARDAVAAGCAATQSLRSGGVPIDVTPVADALRSYFETGQATEWTVER
jgi:predicted dehydrogenase